MFQRLSVWTMSPLLCLVLFTGCAAFKNLTKNNDSDAPEDKWSSVGREGRGNQKKTKEFDWWSNYMESPESRQIQRNLGYD